MARMRLAGLPPTRRRVCRLTVLVSPQLFLAQTPLNCKAPMPVGSLNVPTTSLLQVCVGKECANVGKLICKTRQRNIEKLLANTEFVSKKPDSEIPPPLSP